MNFMCSYALECSSVLPCFHFISCLIWKFVCLDFFKCNYPLLVLTYNRSQIKLFRTASNRCKYMRKLQRDSSFLLYDRTKGYVREFFHANNEKGNRLSLYHNKIIVSSRGSAHTKRFRMERFNLNVYLD